MHAHTHAWCTRISYTSPYSTHPHTAAPASVGHVNSNGHVFAHSLLFGHGDVYCHCDLLANCNIQCQLDVNGDSEYAHSRCREQLQLQ
jgi:hypothetical protein